MTIDMTIGRDVSVQQAAAAMARLSDASNMQVLTELLQTSSTARATIMRKANTMQAALQQVRNLDDYRGKAENIMLKYKQGAMVVKQLNKLMEECSQLPPATAFRAMARIIDTTVMQTPMQHCRLMWDSSLSSDFAAAIIPVIQRMTPEEARQWSDECSDWISTANANMDRTSLKKAMTELGKRQRAAR
jgi:hypothetical protein